MDYNYNPETATLEEQWRFRVALIGEVLDEQLMTVSTRQLLNHHLKELRSIFEAANDENHGTRSTNTEPGHDAESA